MKKLVLIGLAATVALASCSRDEVIVQNPENTISFEGAFVDNMTKAATDLKASNLDKISVYGTMLNAAENSYMNIFNDKDVRKSDGKWTYTEPQYWIKGNSYWFTAIAPYGTDLDIRHWTFTPNNDQNIATSRGTLQFNNEEANADQDLITAVADAIDKVAPSTVGPVEFAFKHQLSRVKFTFKNTFSSSIYKIRVNSIQINDAYASASMNFDAQQAWTGFTGEYSILFENAHDIVAQNANEETLHRYLIPAKKAYSITFDIDILQNVDDIATTISKTMSLPEIDMQKGYSYNIVAELNEGSLPDGGKPIEFDVISVENWENWTEQTIGTITK